MALHAISAQFCLPTQSILSNWLRSIASNERLDEQKKQFVTNIYRLVEAQDIGTDYEELAKQAPTDNIELWYESAVALMTSVDIDNLDIPPQGRLHTANVILTKIIEHSYKVAPFWAQKIAVLDYLATGYKNTGQLAQSDTYIQDILDATTEACSYFPDMQWFIDKRQEMLKKYGEG